VHYAGSAVQHLFAVAAGLDSGEHEWIRKGGTAIFDSGIGSISPTSRPSACVLVA